MALEIIITIVGILMVLDMVMTNLVAVALVVAAAVVDVRAAGEVFSCAPQLRGSRSVSC